jgi:oligopeptide/dipeptide ABC transporter ATP-binding protein
VREVDRRSARPPQSLLAAVPRIGGRRVTLDFTLEGEPPDPRAVPSGCRFRTRCPLAQDVCAVEEPPLCELDGRRVAGHFACGAAAWCRSTSR